MLPNALVKYSEIVRSGKVAVCKFQTLLIDYIENCFNEETLNLDEEQFEKYMSYQQYFPFKLFEWEKFVFALHNCVYRTDGFLRWPTLFLYLGRGSGKNGYLSFEDFCLLTPTNGIKNYHIDIYAVAEANAKTSFEEIYNVLENNEQKMKRFFKWNLEEIENLQTGSKLTYNTANHKSKDGRRPGKSDYDEVHQYENYKLINVGTSGLGKVKHPRRSFISSDGYVREGPLDDMKKQGEQILNGIIPDNGMLPVMFCIETKEDIDNPDAWEKAIPSLRNFPVLKEEVLRLYNDYKTDPMKFLDFPTKRLNFPIGNKEQEVTEYENVKATNKEFISLENHQAILCFDFASTRDMAGIGYITKENKFIQFKSKAFMIKDNKDIPRIQAPLDYFVQKECLEFVKGIEVEPADLIDWAMKEQEKYNLEFVCATLDFYRYPILKKYLEKMGFVSGKNGNLKLVRPSDLMIADIEIQHIFNDKKLICGDNPCFRWNTTNTKIEVDKRGNSCYEKIEPKSRKTDLFFAYAGGMTMIDELPDDDADFDAGDFSPMIF